MDWEDKELAPYSTSSIIIRLIHKANISCTKAWYCDRHLTVQTKTRSAQVPDSETIRVGDSLLEIELYACCGVI